MYSLGAALGEKVRNAKVGLGWFALVALGSLVAMSLLWSGASRVDLTQRMGSANVDGGPAQIPSRWFVDEPTDRPWTFATAFELGDDAPRTIFVPWVGGRVSALIGGEVVSFVEYPPSVLGGIGARSMTIPVPAKAGQVELVLEISATGRGYVGVSEVILGSPRAIERVRWLHWFAHTGLLLVAFTATLLGVVMAWVMWRGTGEPVYAHFTAAATLLIAHLGWTAYVSTRPVTWADAWGLSAMWVLFVGAMVWSAFALTRVDARLRYGACLSWVGFGGLLVTLAALLSMPSLIETMQLSGFAFAALASRVVVIDAAPDQRASSRTFATVMLAAAGLVTVGYAHVYLHGHESGSQPVLLLGTTLMLCTVFFFIVQRFLGAHRDLRAMNTLLGVRVAETEERLRDAYDRLLDRERGAARVAERHRIVQEMHDGLGGHLTAMLSLARSDRPDVDGIGVLAETCLTELKLAIDSLEPQHADLVNALATLRYRLEPVLGNSGIRVDWRIGRCELPRRLTPHEILQLFRILQEAITNVIKHAQATRVSLRCVSSGRLGLAWITLADDGVFGPVVECEGRERHGYGLRNMRSRAEAIGARLLLTRGSQARRGTRVRIAWRV